MNHSTACEPRVSVIIPTYNHANFVLQTLDSVFAQTFTATEIIVVNDGSPDGTAEVLRPITEAGRIRYIEQPNAGQAAARNRGLELARGEFVAFLDDDDLWPADKLEWQVRELDLRPHLLAIAGGIELFENDAPNDTNGRRDGAPPDDITSQEKNVTVEGLCDGPPMISPGQVLIRASVLRQIGGLNETLRGTDDWDLWFRIARIGKIKMVPQLALHYRVHEFNASKNLWGMLRNTLAVIAIQEPLFQRRRNFCLRRSYRFAYLIYGQPLLLQARQELKSGNLSALKTILKLLRIFLVPALRDPNLSKRLVNETLSANSLWKKIKGSLTRG